MLEEVTVKFAPPVEEVLKPPLYVPVTPVNHPRPHRCSRRRAPHTRWLSKAYAAAAVRDPTPSLTKMFVR